MKKLYILSSSSGELRYACGLENYAVVGNMGAEDRQCVGCRIGKYAVAQSACAIQKIEFSANIVITNSFFMRLPLVFYANLPINSQT